MEHNLILISIAYSVFRIPVKFCAFMTNFWCIHIWYKCNLNMPGLNSENCTQKKYLHRFRISSRSYGKIDILDWRSTLKITYLYSKDFFNSKSRPLNLLFFTVTVKSSLLRNASINNRIVYITYITLKKAAICLFKHKICQQLNKCSLFFTYKKIWKNPFRLV